MKGCLLLLLVLSSFSSISQNLSGQWRGSFNSAGNVVANGGETEYVLELYIKGTKVSGYSYSYFNQAYLNEAPKKYYVICRLDGSYEPSSKSVVVNEEERIKGNTPPNWPGDCLQTHILTFLKQGDTEKLVGRWRGSRPDGCGVGSTELERKTLTRVVPPKASTAPVKKAAPSTAKTNKTPQQSATAKPKASPPAAKKPAPKKSPAPVKKTSPESKVGATEKEDLTQKQSDKIPDSGKLTLPDIKSTVVPGFGARSKNILKVIDLPSTIDEFVVDFYDNGEIDGDTISVFYNDKLLLSHRRLSDKPISLKIKLDTTLAENELVMYADNLGSMPPNTALMIATIAGKRHEVYITSTEKSSGTIRFKKKE